MKWMVSSIAISLLFVATSALAQERPAAPPPCAEDPAYRALDFWVGEWDVMVGEKKVGTNRIERILDGCAILEHWTAEGGGEGKSLFYYQKATDRWRQVWVTARASALGGVKEKEMITKTDDGGLRFQGEIPVAGGGSYLDRTTLTPRTDGTVRQVIEVSRDGGAKWETVFDASYVRRR